MSNYTKTTNFTAKDSLPTGDSSKIIKGIPPSDDIPGVSSQRPTAIWIFALLSYIIIIMVKVVANRNVILKTKFIILGHCI